MRYEIGAGVGFDADGKAIPASASAIIVRRIVKEASQRFGGCFIRYGTGGWLNPADEVVEELAITVTIDASANQNVKEFAEFVKHELNQAAVHVAHLPSETYSV